MQILHLISHWKVLSLTVNIDSTVWVYFLTHVIQFQFDLSKMQNPIQPSSWLCSNTRYVPILKMKEASTSTSDSMSCVWSSLLIARSPKILTCSQNVCPAIVRIFWTPFCKSQVMFVHLKTETRLVCNQILMVQSGNHSHEFSLIFFKSSFLVFTLPAVCSLLKMQQKVCF